MTAQLKVRIVHLQKIRKSKNSTDTQHNTDYTEYALTEYLV